jgi:DNA-directed RNA polymerase specialized sigma24 family protein
VQFFLRACLAVWKLEGYTNAEIAERQGWSLPTVGRRLAIIRRLLHDR